MLLNTFPDVRRVFNLDYSSCFHVFYTSIYCFNIFQIIKVGIITDTFAKTALFFLLYAVVQSLSKLLVKIRISSMVRIYGDWHSHDYKFNLKTNIYKKEH